MTDRIEATVERTKNAVNAKTYSYEALAALVAYFSPEVIHGLVELLNYIVGADSSLGVPDEWKPRIRFAAFVLGLFARSIVVRKAKVAPPVEPDP